MAVHIFLNPSTGKCYPLSVQEWDTDTIKEFIGSRQIDFANYRIEGIPYGFIFYDFSALLPFEERYPSVVDKDGNPLLYGNVVLYAYDKGGVTRSMDEEEVQFIMDHVSHVSCTYTPTLKTAMFNVD